MIIRRFGIWSIGKMPDRELTDKGYHACTIVRVLGIAIMKYHNNDKRKGDGNNKFVVYSGDHIMNMSKDYLAFGNTPTFFDTEEDAQRAVDKSFLYAKENGYEKTWGICLMGCRIEPANIEGNRG